MSTKPRGQAHREVPAGPKRQRWLHRESQHGLASCKTNSSSIFYFMLMYSPRQTYRFLQNRMRNLQTHRIISDVFDQHFDILSVHFVGWFDLHFLPIRPEQSVLKNSQREWVSVSQVMNNSTLRTIQLDSLNHPRVSISPEKFQHNRVQSQSVWPFDIISNYRLNWWAVHTSAEDSWFRTPIRPKHPTKIQCSIFTKSTFTCWVCTYPAEGKSTNPRGFSSTSLPSRRVQEAPSREHTKILGGGSTSPAKTLGARSARCERSRIEGWIDVVFGAEKSSYLIKNR